MDVIYIDPPYNTGNKDFKYNDRFVDREDAYRHSKWLSFMHKRLLIAKRLLADTGVIFISIDDNEQAQLKMLCDEVFGEENFVANVIWEKSDSPKMDSRNFSYRHDFVLVYAKQLTSNTIKQISVSENDIAHYNKVDDKGKKYYLKPLRAMGGQGETREARPTLYYGIEAPDSTLIYPKRKDGSDGAWRWSKEKLESESSRIEWTKGKGGWAPNYRIFAENNSSRPPETIWSHQEVGSNRQAKIEVDAVLEITNSFSTPKPTSLLKRILLIAGNKNALILDFFAGSGTTLHATMQLNAEDGGNRQCILVTNNESNIAEEVCYERNRRVIQGYTGRRSGNAKGQAVPGLTNNSLRYYRCETVPRQTTLPAKRLLMQRATELLCIKEGLYDEAGTLSVGNQIRGYGGSGNNYLLIIYDDLCIDEAVALIRHTVQTEAEARFRVYVFSNGQYPYTEEFEEVLPYVTLCALPDALYKAYRQVLPNEQAPARILEEAEESEVPDLFTEIKN